MPARAGFPHLTATADAQWREELDLKFFSQMLPIRAFRPLLEGAKLRPSSRVNSLLAMQPEPHMVCTSAARAGVQNLLKSLASEFAPRIRVNTVLLGLVNSGQWQRRFEARADKAQSREEWFRTSRSRSSSTRAVRRSGSRPRPSFSSARPQRDTSPAPASKSRAACHDTFNGSRS